MCLDHSIITIFYLKQYSHYLIIHEITSRDEIVFVSISDSIWLCY
jgi:hypothetical protein